MIHVALPAMNERDYIERTLECLQKQTFRGFSLWICVNQPEAFWKDPEKVNICHNNLATLELLENYQWDQLQIIDRSSPGKGWHEGKVGVGYARRTLMDEIVKAADEKDIIVSMDADTIFGDSYLESVQEVFNRIPKALALANPYYHPLIDDCITNRAMLRYEVYMRYYALNMRFTGTPFCFSPLGSAMAATIKGYKKINGLTPKKSGEDFYFLQKMAKAGGLLMYNSEIVFPGNRLSDRVFFGTGPAMIKGIAGHWSSYPLFDLTLFEKVKQTIDLFPALFYAPCPTPMDDFFRSQFCEDDIFAPLRINNKDQKNFIRACHQKIDGLRILQFLKANQPWSPGRDEENLREFIMSYFPFNNIEKELVNLDFSSSDVKSIDKIRNFLFESEMSIRRADAEENTLSI